MTSSRFPDLGNPIRMSGLLALLMLIFPGSIQGVLLLLTHAGAAHGLPLVPPQTHAMLQLCGFFMVLIWGFLTHALPGMLGASDLLTHHIRIPVLLLALDVAALWLVQLMGGELLLVHTVYAAGFLVVTGGTALLLLAVARALRSWRARPFPFLIIPLALFPVTWALLWMRAGGVDLPFLPSELLLNGVVVPVILTMSYRMFAPMMGLQLPHPRVFDAAALAWSVGVVMRMASSLHPALPWVSSVFTLVAAAAFVSSLRVFDRSRHDDGSRGAGPHRAVHAYVVAGSIFLVASPLVELCAASGILGGLGFYWGDVARHFIGVGFALLVVMGITQRVLPNMVRGRAPSLPWMWLNLAIVVSGLGLRLGEPFLPGMSSVVMASAGLLYLGVLSFGAHLFRGLVLPSRTAPAVFMTIRRPATRAGGQ